MKLILTTEFKQKSVDYVDDANESIVVKFYGDDVLLYERELSVNDALSYRLYPYGNPVMDQYGHWHYPDRLTIIGNSNTEDGMYLQTVIDDLKQNVITPPQVKRWTNTIKKRKDI